MTLRLQDVGLKLCALLPLSSCLSSGGESGWSPSELAAEEVWAFLPHLSYFKCPLPICVQDAKGRACLVDGPCGERIHAFPTRPPVLKSLLAILILSCLEHFTNCGLLGRRHRKKSGDLKEFNPWGKKITNLGENTSPLCLSSMYEMKQWDIMTPHFFLVLWY